MHNVNRGRDRREEGRAGRSGPDDEAQGDIFGASGAELQSIDLNHATAAQLMTIDGLEPALATAIVDHRVHNGHFTNWDELARVQGVTDELLIEIQRATRIGGQADATGHLPPH